MNMETMCGGCWWLCPIFALLMAVVMVAVVVLVCRRGGFCLPWRGQPNAETALDILKQRYARGEISAEQFEKMKRDVQ